MRYFEGLVERSGIVHHRVEHFGGVFGIRKDKLGRHQRGLNGEENTQTCSTFSNWCTRKMPQVSLPCEPASFRKHVE